MTAVRATGRWRGIVAVALFAVAVGILTDRPPVMLAGVVGAGFALYPRLTGPPSAEFELDRRVDDHHPDRGDPVTVTTRLTNVGDSTLTDVRIIDGVPPMLTVASGSPRHGAVLRPGETTEFSYEVGADHGRHQFDPATVVVRDPTGAHEVETTVAAGTEIDCAEAVPAVPLRQQTNGHAGRLVTDDGGSGIEFHTVREYRPGDPMGRIDSKRWARTGELTTIDFREERRASILLLLDAREPAYRSQSDDEPNAVAHGLAGVEQLLSALADTRDFVGLAAFGREFCWHAPGVGPDHQSRLRQLLQTHPTLSARPPTADEDGDLKRQTEQLRKRLGRDTQIVVFSPLADEAIVEAVRTLEADGHATTVVSPDVTADGTLGRELARVERTNRLHSLRGAGVPVVDWGPTASLGAVLLDEQRRGWSA
ncbi:DUF58 domain-containing protein [Halomicroarcula limicola]|uniref:DUF58 domain-containing protein n=1 Tax=Haloarcula limicola TaxID=1429915 RepID=A0A8J7YBQ5_9EURY|nr:DUF58 domain-containing protein [Halomicroarcula limicola]MBV0924949.1 DUF58 domain-containing protein [Halomicroarcula limicola]